MTLVRAEERFRPAFTNGRPTSGEHIRKEIAPHVKAWKFRRRLRLIKRDASEWAHSERESLYLVGLAALAVAVMWIVGE
jgi:hypothetical protein